MAENSTPALDPGARQFRWGALAGIVAVFAWCGLHDPNRAAVSWLPFPQSCGAISGVPCLFCGGTRAMHQLLHGHFGAAFYYNWLAFPVALGAGLVAVLFIAELACGRALWPRSWRLRVTPVGLAVGMGVLTACWALNVWLAVSQHKTELLNPHGVLYSLLVR